MKSNSALFLVQTPFHVLNALEAISEFDIKQSTFFIANSAPNQKWRKMIELLLPPNAHTILCRRNNLDIEEGTKEYAQHVDSLKASGFDFVFFSDARLYIFVDIVNALNNPSTYLMDDGTGTLLALHNLAHYGEYYDVPISTSAERNQLIEQTKKKYGLWNLPQVKYNLFTVFDYESCEYYRVVNNPMRCLSHTHSDLAVDTVLIIGQPFIKIKHMSSSHYLLCLEQICDFYKDKKKIYLPHPREEQSFVDSLKKSEHITVIDTDLTAEKYLMQLPLAPSTVCGFLSTSLWNIAKYQKGIQVEAFRIPQELFNPIMASRRKRSNHVTDLAFINIIYDYYEKRIPIHELTIN